MQQAEAQAPQNTLQSIYVNEKFICDAVTFASKLKKKERKSEGKKGKKARKKEIKKEGKKKTALSINDFYFNNEKKGHKENNTYAYKWLV